MKIFLKKKDYEIEKKQHIFKQKIANISRVTKVTKGGKKLTFRVLIICGNNNSLVGFGIGKSAEIADAIIKANNNAKKNIIKIPLKRNGTIDKLVIGNFGAAKILIKPAKLGTGIVAGGTTRLILKLAGIKNAVSKQLGTNNVLNNTTATFNALKILATDVKIKQIQKIPIEKFYI